MRTLAWSLQVTLTGRQIGGDLGAKPAALIYYLIRVADPVSRVFLSLLAANPHHAAWRRDADQATLLLLKFADSNHFIKPRALLLRGQIEDLSARTPNARRLVEQASKIAHALGLEQDVRRARQLSVQILA